MGELSHLFLFMWRNFKIKLRHPWIVLLEIFFPVFFLSVFICLQKSSSANKIEIDNVSNPYNIDSLHGIRSYENWKIFYAPNDNNTDSIMLDVGKRLSLSPEGFSSENELVETYKNTEFAVIAGIIFDTDLTNPKSGDIKYRILPELMPKCNWLAETSEYSHAAVKKSLFQTNFMTFGFLPIQNAVTISLMKNLQMDLFSNVDNDFEIQMSKFPYLPLQVDVFFIKYQSLLSIVILLSFFYPCINMANCVMKERERRIQEVLSVAGVENWMNWYSWYFSYLIYFSIICGIMTIMVSVPFIENQKILQQSSPFIFFLWLVLYSSSIIAFCLFIVSLFKKSSYAVTAVFISFFFTLIPYIHLLSSAHKVSNAGTILCGLFPNSMLYSSVSIWVNAEIKDDRPGVQWESINKYKIFHLVLNMKDVLLFFAGDTLIFLVLMSYFNTWFFGRISPRPWYFLLTKTFWMKPNSKGLDDQATYPLEYNQENFEKVDDRIKASIEIIHLTKTFKVNSRSAVENVCLKAYPSQITVLLGHNGSGKTLTFSMLLGQILPSSGYTTIKGYRVLDSNEARMIPQFLGFCPDYNICYDDLTVEENLTFYCRSKGYLDDCIKGQIEHVTSILGLDDVRKVTGCNLTKNLKRMLSIAIALVGESEIVIVDDPTVGLDSYSRRKVWRALKSEKVSRTIFLTTSHMSEAAALGDRIYVMDEGELKCCGSLAFLKKIYGAGYNVTINKETQCNESKVISLFDSSKTDYKMLHSDDASATFFLPYHKMHSYEFLFHDLEEKIVDLGLKDIDVSEIALEELYDKVSFKHGSDDIPLPALENFAVHNEAGANDLFMEEKNKSCLLFIQQATALIVKYYYLTVRQPLMVLFQIFVLSLFYLISLLLLTTDNRKAEVLNLKMEGLEIPYSSDLFSKRGSHLGDIFRSFFENKNKILWIDAREELLNEFLLDLSRINHFSFDETYAFAVAFNTEMKNKTIITAFYNPVIFNSPVYVLNVVHNTILRYKEANGSKLYHFDLKTQALPMKKIEKPYMMDLINYPLKTVFSDIQHLTISMAVLMASFAVPLVIESKSKSKQLQMLNGLSAFSYWLFNFTYDFIIYTTSCFLLVTSLATTDIDFKDWEQIERVAILLSLHGVSGLLFVYCCTCFFYSVSAAFFSILLYYIIGLCSQYAVLWLETNEFAPFTGTLDTIFTFSSPSYCVAQAISNLRRNLKNNEICNSPEVDYLCAKNAKIPDFYEILCCENKCGQYCVKWTENYYDWESPGIGKQIVSLALQAAVLFLVLILFEVQLFRNVRLKLRNWIKRRKKTVVAKYTQTMLDAESAPVNTSEDELMRPFQYSLSSNVDKYLDIMDLTSYAPEQIVNDLSFGVKKGECFALVGPDTLAKHLVLKMIGGFEKIKSGKILIDRRNIVGKLIGAIETFGTNTESGALPNYLSGLEALIFYARLRGIRRNKISRYVQTITNALAIDNCLKRRIQDFSFSEREMFMVAVALIGTPDIILLNKPTRRLDSTSCRRIWSMLRRIIDNGKTILLASDRMDECEALCGSMGVLFMKKLVCAGTLADFKKMCGNAYTVSIKLTTGQCSLTDHTVTDEAKSLMKYISPNATLKGDFVNFLSYSVTKDSIKWSQAFRTLELAKRQEKIKSYSIRHTNLDDIIDDMTEENVCCKRNVCSKGMWK